MNSEGTGFAFRMPVLSCFYFFTLAALLTKSECLYIATKFDDERKKMKIC